MGFDINGTECLLSARNLGVDFTRTAMIGRQGMHLTSDEFQNCLRKFHLLYDGSIVKKVFSQRSENWRPFAEEFLQHLGAKDVHSFDTSDYQKATHIYDFNNSIPDEYKNQYSVVIDSGSLEHVFNFPVAIKNCMEMVKTGGHFISITPGNNFFGHGFYQFSPELFFSMFNLSNGFELISVIAYEAYPNAHWFSVSNPASVNSRVTLINDEQVYLFVIAKKLQNVRPFMSMPNQSDYVSGSQYSWNKSNLNFNIDSKLNKTSKSILTSFSEIIPSKLKRGLKFILRHKRGFNSKFFKKVDKLNING